MTHALRHAEFLDGVAQQLRERLPAPWAEFQARRQGQLLKIWYLEPSLHYEVWPVAGRDLIEVGLHFEASADVNLRLLDIFDPRIFEFKAAVDGAVELEQWTASWAHLHTVMHAARLEQHVQRAVVDWLATIVPLTEPMLAQALADIGPIPTRPGQTRDWTAWRKRHAQGRQPARGR
jgi:hypothetical protein